MKFDENKCTHTCNVANFKVKFDGNVTIIDDKHCSDGSGLQIITDRMTIKDTESVHIDDWCLYRHQCDLPEHFGKIDL